MKLVRALLTAAAVISATAVVQVATAPSASAGCTLCWPPGVAHP